MTGIMLEIDSHMSYAICNILLLESCTSHLYELQHVRTRWEVNTWKIFAVVPPDVCWCLVVFEVVAAVVIC